jgi:hypothetical protein
MKTIQKIFISCILLVLLACSQANMVEKSQADTNLLVGLVAGIEQGKGQTLETLIAVRGSWEQYSCSNGTCSSTIGAHVYIVSEPNTNKGLFYQENPPTCYTTGGCNTAQFEQFADFYPADRSIVSFSNREKKMLTKNNRTIGFSQKDKYSYVLWGELDGQTYTCDLFQNKNTEAEALNDLNAKLSNGTVSTDPSKFKTTGCNGFGWYLWKKRAGIL